LPSCPFRSLLCTRFFQQNFFSCRLCLFLFFSKFAHFDLFLFPVFSANVLNSIHFCFRFFQQICSIRSISVLVFFSKFSPFRATAAHVEEAASLRFPATYTKRMYVMHTERWRLSRPCLASRLKAETFSLALPRKRGLA
jgi:hypothetical protein